MNKTISTQHLTKKEDLKNELNWDEFEILTPSGKKLTKDDFILVAVGNPNVEEEKWDMDIKDERYNNQEDLIYALVVDGKLLKLGKSITTMKERIRSYHCGKNAYRKKENATNSATNWFILQSVLTIGLPVYIYCLYIPKTIGSFMGWEYHNRVSKEIEGRIITTFNDTYGTKPIGNKQF
ncbi:MAG: hypothetical protein IKP35_02420 [Alphaproteobacteria bacterium]|nr:hypothetical protein [Alphaproteobacteria bacterium]